MASKQDFTTDEWNKLLESTMLASIAVTASEPHGLWGALEEGWANAKGLASGMNSPTPLIKEVVAALSTSEGRTIARDNLKQRISGGTPQDVVQRTVAGVGDVAKLLDAKAGADAVPFKQWIYHNAQTVAEAAKEGGFLGFGGTKVSDKEKATLAQIGSALGLPA